MSLFYSCMSTTTHCNNVRVLSVQESVHRVCIYNYQSALPPTQNLFLPHLLAVNLRNSQIVERKEH